MKLGRVKETDDYDKVYSRLVKRHQKYLDRINPDQIESLLQKLIKKAKTNTSNNLKTINNNNTNNNNTNNNNANVAKVDAK